MHITGMPAARATRIPWARHLCTYVSFLVVGIEQRHRVRRLLLALGRLERNLDPSTSKRKENSRCGYQPSFCLTRNP